MSDLTFDAFKKVHMAIGTITEAKPNLKARKPAMILTIDFGDLGIKTSSAQITENYDCDTIIGTQVVAVMNFPPMRVAGVKSEVLVLAGVSENEGTVLLTTTKAVTPGTLIS